MNGKKGKSFYRIICNILTSIHSHALIQYVHFLIFGVLFKFLQSICIYLGTISQKYACVYIWTENFKRGWSRCWCFWHGPLLLSSWVPYFKTQRLYFHQAGNLKDFLLIMWQLKLKFLMMFNGHQRDRCKKQICLAHVYVHVTMVTIYQI